MAEQNLDRRPIGQTDPIERNAHRTPRESGGVIGPRAMVLAKPDMGWLDVPRDQLRATLSQSLYPGAKPESVDMVLNYCEAAGLNVMLKPVHLVPMNVKKAGTNNYEWRDVVMPGINHYRTQASRSGTYTGKSEPEFGPMQEGVWGNIKVRYPEWCKVTVKRLIGSHIAEFTAIEYWDENFATGGRDKPWPNTMWAKRPRGQIAKCAEAQALRMAFPELTGDATAEEMEGKVIDIEAIRDDGTVRPAAVKSLDQFAGPAAGEPVDGEATDLTDDQPGDKQAAPFVMPVMPEAELKAWTDKQEWKTGWKWLNKVMGTIPEQADRQRLADLHTMLLWAVYDSDAATKGNQSKAAQAFASTHGIAVAPKVMGEQNDG